MPKLDPKAASAAVAAMLAIATPLVATWEGYSAKPYLDVIGKKTVCFGETRVEMREYTKAECTAMLNDGVGEFAWGVAKRNPELVGHPNQWAAATSLAYNAGLANYNRSTVAKRFSAGNWRGACDALLAWNRAGGRVVKGLVRRREAERTVCLKDLP